jgi:DNA-binding Lrp family transcriptional regulator
MQDDYRLDKTDLAIIGQLARDSRLSYEKIGSTLHLTRNSVKTRIRRMVSAGTIQEFVPVLNYAALGYKTTCSIEVRVTNSREINSRDSTTRKTIIDHLNHIGDIFLEIEELGGSSVFVLIIKESIDYDRIRSVIINTLGPGFLQNVFLRNSNSTIQPHTYMKPYILTNTDLRVLRSLVLDPQIGVAEISKQVSVSARTVNRILTRLKDGGIIEFSVILNPAALKGYVIFAVLIYVNEIEVIKKDSKRESPASHKILQRLHNEFPEYPLWRGPFTGIDNEILVGLLGKDLSAIDSMFRKVQSFEEVNKAELHIFTKLVHHKDWVIREIDSRLN